MENEDDDTEATTDLAGRFDELVSLRCGCGAEFKRPQEFIDKAKEYADEYPTAARFFQRKITLCDKCHKAKVERALKCLPEIMKALAS